MTFAVASVPHSFALYAGVRGVSQENATSQLPVLGSKSNDLALFAPSYCTSTFLLVEPVGIATLAQLALT